MQDKSTIFAILLIASPIIFALVAFPNSFSLSWNQGRGGFLFALAFIVAELVGLKLVIPKKRLLAAIPLAALMVTYLVSLEFGLRDYIISVAPNYNVQLIFSWTWMWDFIVLTIFLVASMNILFGKRWIRISPAGPIFAAGNGVFLSLDAFFPYDTLGPLQYVVPYLAKLNVWLITMLDLGTATAHDNVMFLRGDHGPMVLQVFWPSAGVDSIIIYSLIMMAFLLKLNIQPKRKAVYFALGIIGTIGVNVIRIFSLSVYALKVTTGPEWEGFHSIAGVIMFLPWLFIFLLIVINIETRRIKRLEFPKKENMIKINKEVNVGTYSLNDIFDGLKNSSILMQIFKTKKELDDVFSKTNVIIEKNDHYMFVKTDDASIVIGLDHLQKSDSKTLYLDIIHELIHVKQQRQGLDLYDKSYSYVDRPTEIEAYEVAVKEAKRLGMNNKEISDYLHVEWITPEEHERLASRMGVTS